MIRGGEWLTFRELSQVTDIGWNKLRYLRDSGTLTDLGMVLYQVPCRVYSKWWIWVPDVFCHYRLHSFPPKTDYSPRNAPKT